ncbi:MAG: NYN domain-containing protein [Micromonosporaceae bacterium]|nr:NYN domain-containing protein [Micromonosporaceae bacterium]
MRPLVIVDGANVVGSVPDGWWRDRLGAARRLRDALPTVVAAGLADLPGPVEVVLVVEGAAADLAAEPAPDGVHVVAAPRTSSGDDAIVDLVAAAEDPAAPCSHRRCVVVTADRGLRERVSAHGARVVGPRALPYPPPGPLP